MNQLSLVAPSGLGPSHDGAADGKLVELWLSMKTSSHTRRAYAADAAHFLAFVHKPLARVTLTDLQAWAGHLGQGSLKPASQNRAITAVKSLLSFAQETGYLPFNVGAAVKLQPNRDGLAQRILEESEVARLIDAAPQGRNRVLLKLLYVSGLRVSEICGLKWCDALTRPQGGQITVFGKGGKTRTVLLKPKVWQQLLVHQRRSQGGRSHLSQPQGRARARCLPSPAHRLRRSQKSRPGTEGLTPLDAARPCQPRARPQRARFTWCRQRSGMLRFPPPAAICMPGPAKVPASIYRIN